MSLFASARWVPAVLLFFVFVLAGCASNVGDGTGTSEGAATVAPPPAADASAALAGNYGAHMNGEWDGSLEIKDASSQTFVFEFDISPDLDVAPIGRLSGTAKLANGHYQYDDGFCTIDFEPATDEPAAKRGDLFVNANTACGLMLGLDDHSTSSTALDFTATWSRLR